MSKRTEDVASESVPDIPGITIKRKKLADFLPNPDNPVSHGDRNIGMVIDSIQEVGALRSGAASKGKMLAGNITLEAMEEAGIEDVLEVTTNGKIWVVVNREDLSPDQERRAAYLDQRAGELAGWDADQIVADLEDGLDLDDLFDEDELEDLVEADPANELDEDRELEEIDLERLPERPTWILCVVAKEMLPDVAPLLQDLRDLGIQVEVSDG